MSAEIDQNRGLVNLTCDYCGVSDRVSTNLATGHEWRFKDGANVFCSETCETRHNEKKEALV
jgi:hypothetical protein